jgi:hypothetical protein
MKITPNSGDKFPTVQQYQEFVQSACVKFALSKDEVRDAYGLLTTNQWLTLLDA